MSSRRRHDDPPPRGRGPAIAVATIATTGGVAALLAYHTNPGLPTLGWPAAAAPAAPQSPVVVPTTTSGTPTGTAERTVTGRPVDTRWGIVQVAITVRDGRVIAATAPKSPTGNKTSDKINERAVPILNRQAVQAGSARIDGVSGATVTSNGYRQSLQSALDLAHLG